MKKKENNKKKNHTWPNSVFTLRSLDDKHHRPSDIYFSFQHTFVLLLLGHASAVIFKARTRADRDFKAINNQMLSESC